MVRKSLNIVKLKFPIGKFIRPKEITNDHIQDWINEIELFPSRIYSLASDLTEVELNWRYRPGGWTIKQVVHHCADSHMNSFMRFKLSLTEDSPKIKSYFEDRWAELPDSTNSPISLSLNLIDALHSRWITLLKSLDSNDLKREFIHPENGLKITLAVNTGIYAWHSNHHLAHIKQALRSEGEYTK